MLDPEWIEYIKRGIPVVSILTPTYNNEKYIAKCIESVVAQSFQYWEQIIVDDGSTDMTGQIAKKYTSRDRRIRYIHQKHLGPEGLADTCNKALGEARAPLIAILESDDYWPPYKLELQIATFNKPDVVLSYGWAIRIDEYGRDIAQRFPPKPLKEASIVFNYPRGSVLRELLLHNFIPFSTVIFRRDALKQIGGFVKVPYLPTTDYPTLLKIALLGEFAYLDQPMVFFRLTKSGVSAKRGLELACGGKRFAVEFFQEVKEKGTLPNMAVTEEQISKVWEKYEHAMLLLRGIRLLMTANWKMAEKTFKQARIMKCPSATRRLVGLAGLLTSKLHVNPRILIKLLQASRYERASEI